MSEERKIYTLSYGLEISRDHPGDEHVYDEHTSFIHRIGRD
jgi:hypothetical protein